MTSVLESQDDPAACSLGKGCWSTVKGVIPVPGGGFACPECTAWICALCLVRFQLHSVSYLLPPSGGLEFIHEAHENPPPSSSYDMSGREPFPVEFPPEFIGVLENGVAYCRPQTDVNARVGFYDIHVRIFGGIFATHILIESPTDRG